jgi:hypothetical protein
MANEVVAHHTDDIGPPYQMNQIVRIDEPGMYQIVCVFTHYNGRWEHRQLIRRIPDDLTNED